MHLDVYWLEQTEADLPSGESWLGSNEVALLNRMHFPKRRADWKLGRWTAKRAVATYLNLPGGLPDLAVIEILPTPSGAPQVWLANQSAPLTISISHSSGTAVCAVAPFGAVLGCDLELIEPRSEVFVLDYFTMEERATISRVLPEDRSLFVNLLWSAKESALKTLGEGLRLDTRSVVVNLVSQSQLCPATAWQPLQVCVANGQRFDGWWQWAADFVRTLIAAPAPAPPISISASAWDASHL